MAPIFKINHIAVIIITHEVGVAHRDSLVSSAGVAFADVGAEGVEGFVKLAVAYVWVDLGVVSTGVAWVGHFDSEMGMGNAMRDISRCFRM